MSEGAWGIGGPGAKREDVVSVIAAREHAEILAEQLKGKIERFLNFEMFCTEKDDHTASLSERVTILEKELGEIRWKENWERQNAEYARAHRRWWHSFVPFRIVRRR